MKSHSHWRIRLIVLSISLLLCGLICSGQECLSSPWSNKLANQSAAFYVLVLSSGLLQWAAVKDKLEAVPDAIFFLFREIIWLIWAKPSERNGKECQLPIYVLSVLTPTLWNGLPQEIKLQNVQTTNVQDILIKRREVYYNGTSQEGAFIMELESIAVFIICNIYLLLHCLLPL